VAFSLYYFSLHSPFIYDDLGQVALNNKLLFPESFWDILFCGIRQSRVLINFSLALNAINYDGSTLYFHLFNNLFHAANSCLLFYFLKNALNISFSKSLLTALLFVVHPLQIESVTYIMGRSSLFVFFFFITALIIYSKKKDSPLYFYFFLIFSLLAKETLALIPFSLIAYDFFIENIPVKKMNWKKHALYLSSALFFIPIAILLKDPSSMYKGSVGFDLFPYIEYLLTQTYYYFFYFYIFFNPSSQSMIHHYPQFSDIYLYSGVAFIFLSIITLFYFRKNYRTYRKALFLGLLGLITLAPTNTFLQMFNPFAEYRLYVSNIFMCYVTVSILFLSFRYIQSFFLRGILTTFMFSYFIIFQIAHQKTWNDPFKVYSDSLTQYPSNARAYEYLADHFRYTFNSFAPAELHYIEAIKRMPSEVMKSFLPHQKLSELYFSHGKYFDAVLLYRLFHKEISLKSELPQEAQSFYTQYLTSLNKLGLADEHSIIRAYMKNILRSPYIPLYIPKEIIPKKKREELLEEHRKRRAYLTENPDLISNPEKPLYQHKK
jgi:hypothetical protein